MHGRRELSWLIGQPNVAASIKREADISGDLDSDGAAGFLRGLLEVLRQTGRKGLVLVLDQVETIQRVRGDSREKSLNALRQLIDDVHGGRYPGLYVVITGTPAFFDGPQGIRRSKALADRLQTDCSGDPRFHNPRAPQIWLTAFDQPRLVSVGRRVRDLYVSKVPDRAIVIDTYGLRLWTFGGGKANNLLAQCLEERLGEKLVVDNLYVAFRAQAAASEAAIREAIADLRREGRPNDADALRLAENCARGRLSKFQTCLPPRLEAAFLAEVLTDAGEARRAIAEISDTLLRV